MSKHLVSWKRKAENAPAKREESRPLLSLHRQMNELFADYFRDFGNPRLPSLLGAEREEGMVMPRVDVAETADAIQVTAELPGMDEKDIEVTLNQGCLLVRGEKKQEREEQKKDYYFSERSFGSFQRLIPLPAGISKDKVKAQFKKGVLRVTIQKSEQAKAERRKIPISKE